MIQYSSLATYVNLFNVICLGLNFFYHGSINFTITAVLLLGYSVLILVYFSRFVHLCRKIKAAICVELIHRYLYIQRLSMLVDEDVWAPWMDLKFWSVLSLSFSPGVRICFKVAWSMNIEIYCRLFCTTISPVLDVIFTYLCRVPFWQLVSKYNDQIVKEKFSTCYPQSELGFRRSFWFIQISWLLGIWFFQLVGGLIL